MVTCSLTIEQFFASQTDWLMLRIWEGGAGNVCGKINSPNLGRGYMKQWLCVIGLALSLGCASAVVRPYIGEQQAWPTGTGSIVSTNYSLPVFTSLPPVPYDVLAELRISSPFYAQPEEGHLPLLVSKAKKLGADALVFVQGKVFFSTNYGPRNGVAQNLGEQKPPSLTTVNTFNPDSFAADVNVLAVRWTGEAPAGLPSHRKAAAAATTPTAEAPPSAATPAPTQPAPAATPVPEPPPTNSTPAASAPSQ
jgi:hypothetical protein